jgi:hypothetical protein
MTHGHSSHTPFRILPFVVSPFLRLEGVIYTLLSKRALGYRYPPLWRKPAALTMLKEAMNSVHCSLLFFLATVSFLAPAFSFTQPLSLTAPSDGRRLARFTTQCRLWSYGRFDMRWGLHSEPFSSLTGHEKGNFRSASNAISLISDYTSLQAHINWCSVMSRGRWRRQPCLGAC